MVSRPGSPTAESQMEAIQPTENIIEEPQLLRLKLSRRSQWLYATVIKPSIRTTTK